MRKFTFQLLLFFLTLSITPISSAEVSSKHILNNGLTVLVHEMPANAMVSVYALVKTGSATEGKFLGTGISHYLEHMLFKETKNRAVGEIASEIQAIGGTINASTGKDYTMYTINVPAEFFDNALEILSDMLINAVMDEEELEKEREVIYGEMRLRNDNPDRKLNQTAYRNIYIRHPYRHPIIGYKSLLEKVSKEDVLEYYHDFYTPNNIILSIAGNVNTQEVLPKIKQAFQSFDRGRDILRNLPQEPEQITLRYYEEEYPTDLTRMSMAFSSVSLLNKDLFALDVLAKILGQGRSSRLYLNVYKEKDLVHSVASYNYTPTDRGVFEINIILEQENVERAIEAVIQEIDNIKIKSVKNNELEKAKRQVLSEHILGRQKPSSIAYGQALDEAFTGDYQFSNKYVNAIAKVKLEEIPYVAKKYLNEDALTITIVKPQNQNNVEELNAESNPTGEIQKFTLPNGMRILLKEDHALPVTSIRLVLNGGTRQETVELNGLSQMMSTLWLKGTKSKSARQIAEKAESLGMRLGQYSGKNSFGIQCEFLSEDIDEALNLIKDLARNPSFPVNEIPKIKKDMRASIRQREDDIFRYSIHALKEILFLKHPFRLETEGSLESIDRISRQDIIDFYNRVAVPNNSVLSVFGDINSEEVLEKIKLNFSQLKNKDVQLKSYSESPPSQPRRKTLSMNKKQAMVMVGFQGVSLKDKDRYGLKVLTSILGSSFSGRLFTRVREELGQAYTLGGYFIPGIDAGFICFYVLTSNDSIQKVEELIRHEINDIRNNDVSDQELKNIKTYLKGTFKANHQTNDSLNFASSLDELYGLGFQHYQKYDNNIDQVNVEDIKRVAQQYLNLNNAAILITRSEY